MKVLRKGILHAVELDHTKELIVVEERDQLKSTNYVRMLVNMCSLTLLTPQKRPTNNSQSSCGVELPMLQDLIISKHCLNTNECRFHKH